MNVKSREGTRSLPRSPSGDLRELRFNQNFVKKILNLTIVNWYENCCWFGMDFKPLLKTLNFLIDGNTWLWCTSPSVATKIWKCSNFCNHRSASANIYRYLQINNNIYRSISIFTDQYQYQYLQININIDIYRSAPAKPKSLVPITPPCLGNDSKKIRRQVSKIKVTL